jgi:hypothetical protein
MKKLIHSLFLATVFLIVTVACKNQPVNVFKANPHYFYYKNKPLVLITSDHHYGAVIDLDFNYEKFLDYLSVNGMNLTRIYPGGMFESPDKYHHGNPLGPLPGKQILPWKKSNQSGANPLLAEEGNQSFKFDLDSWNPEYFKRLKAFVNYAKKKNVIVEIAFFNGMYYDCWPLNALQHENNIQNVGQYSAEDCGLFTTNDPRNSDVIKYQKEYIKKIATELNDFDNVIYDICDEPSLQGLHDGSIILLPDSLIIPWINEMKSAFLQAEEILPNKHILGQTVQNLSPDFSGEEWCDWLPCEYVKPADKALKMNYKNNKPLVNVESNYFGCGLTKNPYTADAVRLEGWWFMLAGGAGNINLNGEYYHGQETGGTVTQKEIIPQRKVLKEFMDSFDLSGLSRFNDFSGVPDGAFCNILADPGKQYAFYLFHGAYESEWGSNFIPEPGNYRDSLILNAIPAGNYRIEWIEPASGIVKSMENLKWQGGNLALKTPEYLIDIAFRMRKS